MEISREVPYSDDWDLGFDSDAIAQSLLAHFPEAELDPRDLAQEEVKTVQLNLDSLGVCSENREIMMRQIRGKAARIGPVYLFVLVGTEPQVRGRIAKWSIRFQCDEVIDEVINSRILKYLEQFNKGKLVTSD
jgi:hypothetical protein